MVSEKETQEQFVYEMLREYVAEMTQNDLNELMFGYLHYTAENDLELNPQIVELLEGISWYLQVR